jgi:signal transduction histidine kinase
MIIVAQEYMFYRPDSSIIYGVQALRLANKYDLPKYSVSAMVSLARAYRTLGNETKALQIIIDGINIAEANNLPDFKATFLMQSGDIYANAKNYKKSLEVLKEAKILFDSLSQIGMSANTQNYIGQTYLMSGQPDSALYYFQSAYNVADTIPGEGLKIKCLVNLGKVQAVKGNSKEALKFYLKSLKMANDPDEYFAPYFQTASLYKEIESRDSSVYYGQLALEVALINGLYKNSIEASELLSDVYKGVDYEKALQYKTLASLYKDSLYVLSNNAAIEGFSDFDKRERQRELEVAESEFSSQLRTNALLGSSFTLMVIAFFLYRNNRQKQKAKQKIESAYDQLKSTQSQLIQSEKMASLGELTAGIAHEIQNPLNFVNNFSEVSKELAIELKEEVLKSEIDKGLISEIAEDIVQNQDKIHHHGQRASTIVKGMLEHSRTSDGKKELTDINALADEYLRLAYHGLRAKDKSFNADFKTEFDESLPKINVIPQDIGRVLLNLINNAFYVVSSKASQPTSKASDGEEATEDKDYKPLVIVSTKKLVDKIEISVKDNGPGIPAEIKDKIFQPFFTTKPTGSGTGLGLSLSYDIVKAHGGELKVDSKEGECTEFIIQLPVNNH